MRVESIKLVNNTSIPYLDKTATSKDNKEADNSKDNNNSNNRVDDFTNIKET